MEKNEYSNLLKRIERLESLVLPNARKREEGIEAKTEYSGATGGLKLLVTEGFFDKKKYLGEINSALSSKNYNYSPQAIQSALNRLSKPNGLLVKFQEKGGKVYAKRK
jgi:hypothetical protein